MFGVCCLLLDVYCLGRVVCCVLCVCRCLSYVVVCGFLLCLSCYLLRMCVCCLLFVDPSFVVRCYSLFVWRFLVVRCLLLFAVWCFSLLDYCRCWLLVACCSLLVG